MEFLEMKYIFIIHKCVYLFLYIAKYTVIKISSQAPLYNLNYHKKLQPGTHQF